VSKLQCQKSGGLHKLLTENTDDREKRKELSQQMNVDVKIKIIFSHQFEHVDVIGTRYMAI
jgi:hypothetical protein